MTLLHEMPDFKDLLAVVGDTRRIDPGLVEKDYWIMHSLWGLRQLDYKFELKGGTSLSKGFGIIHRFSEDIDIRIEPPADLKIGKNQNKTQHVAARFAFYDGLANEIAIAGVTSVERDNAFDDEKARSGGIRLNYAATRPLPESIKQGILLEVGFDTVAPNRQCDISSWAYDQAASAGIPDLTDNRAMAVACYEPGYTLVEKLQTISTKYRLQQALGGMPKNFMRHYYDVYCLLGDQSVREFIGTDAYKKHKEDRFPGADNQDIAANAAFSLNDAGVRALYATEYAATSALYYQGQPSFDELLARIAEYATKL